MELFTEPPHSVADLAYFAGLFDGEGCITATRMPRGISIRLLMGSADHGTRRFAAFVGVVIGVYCYPAGRRGSAARARAVMLLSIHRQADVVRVLRMLYPYLREKRLQAAVALYSLEHAVPHQRYGRLSERQHQIRDRVLRLLKRLKHRHSPYEPSTHRYAASAALVPEAA